MTANLTVPADVWACQQPGVPLVAAIVEGEPTHQYWPQGHSNHVPTHPPAWLVALRDARCEECERTFDRMKGKYTDAAWQAIPQRVKRVMREDVRRRCPNCVDGRLLHDVRVGCDGCGGSCGPEQWALAWKCCPDCGCGPVRCLVDVVPVVDPDIAGQEPQRPAVIVYDKPGLRVYYERQRTPQYGDVRIAHVDALAAACGKPPADWVPGGYAVILTETS